MSYIFEENFEPSPGLLDRSPHVLLLGKFQGNLSDRTIGGGWWVGGQRSEFKS